jgi:DNA/RNA-binding domain of Phe-tRNA-synthetase-like protein
MNEFHYTIFPEIFQRFPGYLRGVVVAHDVTNCPSPAGLVSLLRDAEQTLRSQLDLAHIAEQPRILSWREAFRSFGAKPSEFRSSIEALARRVLRDEPLPSINALVDIGNLLSLRHLIPTGGHAIDHLNDDIDLRLATGKEEFIPLGSEQMEHPLPGEVIFAQGNTVLTRRWTWRQGTHTLTQLDTTAIEFNVDGLPPVPLIEVEQVCGEIIELVGRFCGGRMRYEVLSEDRPGIELGILGNNLPT